MELLLNNAGRIMPKDLIIEKIWGLDSDVEYNNIEVYISFLRQKMAFLGTSTQIRTVRGVGYQLEAMEEKDWKLKTFNPKFVSALHPQTWYARKYGAEMGRKHDKKTTAPIHSDNYVMHRFYLSFGFIDTEPFHDGCQPESGLSSIIGAHPKEEYL